MIEFNKIVPFLSKVNLSHSIQNWVRDAELVTDKVYVFLFPFQNRLLESGRIDGVRENCGSYANPSRG